MKRISYSFLAIFIFSLLSACNPEERIPAYVQIESIDLQTGLGQGSTSADFKYARLFSGIEDLGQFFLPAQIPILKEGTHQIDIFPGINDNGISATPVPYALLKPISVDVDLQAGMVTPLSVTASYKDNLEFVFIEEFESENQVFREELDNDPITSVNLTSDIVFEGSRSAILLVDDEHPTLMVGSSIIEELPLPGVPVYLELNYQTEETFEVGISWLSTSGGRETSFQNAVTAKSEWGKIYINFTTLLEILNTVQGLEAWQIVLRLRMPVEDGQIVIGERKTYLDNFKLIYVK
ncbi:MAG: hypothetical protein HKN16_03160 [Saprospiraceae bacterium]|nr:hypothetical protein [Saprospiraceae bacterium]